MSVFTIPRQQTALEAFTQTFVPTVQNQQNALAKMAQQQNQQQNAMQLLLLKNQLENQGLEGMIPGADQNGTGTPPPTGTGTDVGATPTSGITPNQQPTSNRIPEEFVPIHSNEKIIRFASGGKKAQNLAKTFENQNKVGRAEHAALLKSQKERQLITEEGGKSLLQLIDRMEENLPFTGTAFGRFFSEKGTALGFNREAVKKSETFNTDVRKLIALTREQETKGTLNKELFKDLRDRVPEKGGSQQANLGKLQSFRNEILDSLAISGFNTSQYKKELAIPGRDPFKLKQFRDERIGKQPQQPIEQQQLQQQQQVTQSPQQSVGSDTVRIISKDGTPGTIPRQNLQAAIEAGAKQI